jgi:hypothetical protein
VPGTYWIDCVSASGEGSAVAPGPSGLAAETLDPAGASASPSKAVIRTVFLMAISSFCSDSDGASRV